MKKLSQIIFLGLVFFFIGWNLFNNLQQIKAYDFNINYLLFLLSTITLLFISFFWALLWGIILKKFGSTLNWWQIIDIWMKSLLAKYIPGGIWNLMGRIYLCQQVHVSHSATLGSMTLEFLLSILAQVILVSFLGTIYLTSIVSVQLIIMATGLICLIGILIYPPVFTKLLKFLLKKENFLDLPKLKFSTLLVWLILYTMLHALSGFASFLFISSFYQLSWPLIPIIIAIVNFSFVVGLLTPLAPNGLGVREGLLATLLSYWVPLPIAILVSLATRVWLIISEFITVMLTHLLLKLVQKK